MTKQDIVLLSSLSVSDRILLKWAGSIERPERSLWMEDHVTLLKGIGDAKAEKLTLAGIETMKDTCKVGIDRMKEVHPLSCISVNALTIYHTVEATMVVREGRSPFPNTSNWVACNSNPHKTRYKDDWQEKWTTSQHGLLTRFSSCVTELVKHIKCGIAKSFANNLYAKD